MRKTHRRGLFCFLIFLGCFVVSCSNQQLFDAVRADGIQRCEQELNEAARQDCLKAYETSYDEYEKARTADIEN